MSRMSVLAALVVLVSASALEARESYMYDIPSAPVACHTCHTPGPGLHLNSFGRDAQQVIAGDEVIWERLVFVDSDEDGFSNGQELGDPCGGWSKGMATPRVLGLGHPAQKNEVLVRADDGCLNANNVPDDLLRRPSVAPGVTISNDAGQVIRTCQSTSGVSLTPLALLLLLRRRRS